MYYYRNLLRFLDRVARQANRHEKLFERSEFFASKAAEPSASNDYDNRTAGLRAQDVFAPFFVSFLSVMKEMIIRKPRS